MATTMAQNDQQNPTWIHLQGAADTLQVSERTMKRLLQSPEWRRKLGAVKIGGQWRFARERLCTLYRHNDTSRQ